MPIFQFGRALKIAPKTRISLELKVGLTRATSSNVGDVPTRGAKGKAVGQRTRQKRRRLAEERKVAREEIPEGCTLATGGLPDFLIIGAQKCGTTFLYDLLSLHPEVEPATTKEVHYLDQRFGEGVEWYRSHFAALPRSDSRRAVTGEATPYYLFYPHAPARAARLMPEARLLILLRNPVDRAYSHYHHMLRRGRESLSFKEAVRAEEFRLRGEVEKIMEDERYHSYNHQWFSYLSRGVYIDQILAWQQYFDARQMLVLKSEDLFSDTLATFKTAARFLGLEDWEPAARAPTVKTGGYAPMEPGSRRWLQEYFEPHNRRLYEHVGADLGW